MPECVVSEERALTALRDILPSKTENQTRGGKEKGFLRVQRGQCLMVLRTLQRASTFHNTSCDLQK